MQPLPVIQMFWHGPPLSRVERVSLASFVHHGHAVHLYVYDEPPGVPRAVTLKDAAEILPKRLIFRHRRTQSLALFADWFRYRLLFERGGIWADTDMVCLKPFDYQRPRLFAWQDERLINNAVLGLPAGDPLASWMATICEHPNRWLPYDTLGFRLRKLNRRFLRGDRRGDARWGESGPMGLTRAISHFGYMGEALPPSHFYPVPYENFRALFESPRAGSEVRLDGSHAVHLWNNLIERESGGDKGSSFPPDSPFERLCAHFLGERAESPVIVRTAS